MKVKVKRLWHGNASVRDITVNKALQAHEGLEIECSGSLMRVPYENLRDGAVGSVELTSKHNPNQTYRLIDYPWKAQTNQFRLL